MARKDAEGSSSLWWKVQGAKIQKNINADEAMRKAKVPSKKGAYGRRGSAANQKRMMDNEADGTSWSTGYKTGLPDTVSTMDSAKRVAKALNNQAEVQRRRNAFKKAHKIVKNGR